MGIPVKNEFRLFIHGMNLRAISQYQCYTVISEFQSKEIQHKIYCAICSWWKKVYKTVPYYDCTVDIIFYDLQKNNCDLWDETNIYIVEINSFGAGSLCGSSLFSWVTDFDILYKAKVPEIRFIEQGY